MPPTSEVVAKVSPFSPIRNSSESRGLCCRSCFGPRTCGRGITNSSKRFGALNQGFPFSPLQCRQGRVRMGGGWWLRGNVYVACSDCVVDLVLRDLVAWRHFVRGLRRLGVPPRPPLTEMEDRCATVTDALQSTTFRLYSSAAAPVTGATAPAGTPTASVPRLCDFVSV